MARTVQLQTEAQHRRLAWIEAARPKQLPPPGAWRTLLILAGRGFGKTAAAMNDAAWYGVCHPGARIALVAATAAESRDVLLEGESGLLAVLADEDVEHYNRSLGEIKLTNGALYKTYSSEKPDALRGPQHHRAYVDELGKYYRARELWTQLGFGLRLGSDPRAIVTTTPRPISLLKELMDRESTVTVRGSTFDNAENLAPGFLEEIQSRYGGTRVGQQEIEGRYLDDVPGSLWSREMIQRVSEDSLPDMQRVVISCDPAVTSGESADSTGITAVSKGVDGNAYVLADRTCKLSPDGWANRIVTAFEEFSADRVIGEVNNGGDLVEAVVKSAAPKIPFKKIHASRGKRLRAEPVAALYEQQRVFHLPGLQELEDEMVSFLPEGMDHSPDRTDALVHGLTELMLNQSPEPNIRRLSFG